MCVTVLEPIEMSLNNKMKLDGLTSEPWEWAGRLAWDGTCVETLAVNYLADTFLRSWGGCGRCETKKISNLQLVDRTVLFPIGVETFGP